VATVKNTERIAIRAEGLRVFSLRVARFAGELNTRVRLGQPRCPAGQITSIPERFPMVVRLNGDTRSQKKTCQQCWGAHSDPQRAKPATPHNAESIHIDNSPFSSPKMGHHETHKIHESRNENYGASISLFVILSAAKIPSEATGLRIQ